MCICARQLGRKQKMPNTTSQSNNINATDWWLTGYTIKNGKKSQWKGKEHCSGSAILSYWYRGNIYCSDTEPLYCLALEPISLSSSSEIRKLVIISTPKKSLEESSTADPKSPVKKLQSDRTGTRKKKSWDGQKKISGKKNWTGTNLHQASS